MKSVAMFNNKGGVGKTTLLCNLASFLALRLSKRVLVVDCDPQCNTTQLMMGEEFASDFYWEDTPAHGISTIYELLTPIQEGDSSIASQVTVIANTEHAFGVDLLAGHPSLSFLEDKLSQAWVEVSGGQISGYRKTNWARQLCKQLDSSYDIVLFDVGPSLGALNRSVLLGCDHFVTPMGTDIFSILGLRNIAKWLHEAIRTYEHGLPRCDEQTPGSIDRYSIPREPSIKSGFLGYTMNQYLTKSKGGERRATDRHEDILRKIPNEISKLQESFGHQARDPSTIKLGDIPHMYSLIPLAQTRAKPIIELASRDGIVGSQYKSVEAYETIMQGIAERFLSNLGLQEQSE